MNHPLGGKRICNKAIAPFLNTEDVPVGLFWNSWALAPSPQILDPINSLRVVRIRYFIVLYALVSLTHISWMVYKLYIILFLPSAEQLRWAAHLSLSPLPEDVHRSSPPPRTLPGGPCFHLVQLLLVLLFQMLCMSGMREELRDVQRTQAAPAHPQQRQTLPVQGQHTVCLSSSDCPSLINNAFQQGC